MGPADNTGQKYHVWHERTREGRNNYGKGRVWADLLRSLQTGTQFGVYQHVNK